MLDLGTKRDRDKGGKNWNLVQQKEKRKELYRTRLKVQSPSNLEVTPDAQTIDNERRKSEIEIGSKACQS
ncbi:hypothetical protein TNCV_3765161 [Trichonephila clavipes]|nr:hypothetical protein TNCV_3765161 [Trichonephila clavipes]